MRTLHGSFAETTKHARYTFQHIKFLLSRRALSSRTSCMLSKQLFVNLLLQQLYVFFAERELAPPLASRSIRMLRNSKMRIVISVRPATGIMSPITHVLHLGITNSFRSTRLAPYH